MKLDNGKTKKKWIKMKRDKTKNGLKRNKTKLRQKNEKYINMKRDKNKAKQKMD